jgi:hypothetical protein
MPPSSARYPSARPASDRAKLGGHQRFQRFDMKADTGQTSDLSNKPPRVFERLKSELLRINQGVMTDASDWNGSESS